jgi:hypothetical protein
MSDRQDLIKVQDGKTMNEPNYHTPTERLIFDGSADAVEATAILRALWHRREPMTAAESAKLLAATRRLHCVAEELDCRRRGTAAVQRRD